MNMECLMGSQSRRRNVSHPRFEMMEPRVHLAADLAVTIGALTGPQPLTLGEQVKIPIIVSNTGDASATGPIKIQLIASADGTLDDGDTVLQTLTTTTLNAGQSKKITSSATLTPALPAGSYTLFAVADPLNEIAESNDGNNTSTAGGPVSVVWKFGKIDTRKGVPLNYIDGDGTRVTLRLSGNGGGTLTKSGDDYSLTLAGTDPGTVLSISTNKSGDGRATLRNITISGAMKSINAPRVDITGDITLSGSASSITLGDIIGDAPHNLSIGGTSLAKAGKITLGNAAALTVESGMPIKTLSVLDWDAPAGEDQVTAPWIERIRSKADFAAGLTLSGENAPKSVLKQVSVTGAIGNAVGGVPWRITGTVGTISAGDVLDGWSCAVSKKVSALRVARNYEGDLAADAIDSVYIKGDMTGGHVLAGADLGADGRLGGSAENADLFYRGAIGSFRVSGDMDDSVLGAGLDPTDGEFNIDGGPLNDFITGRSKSSIKSVRVGGEAINSLFGAGAFPKKVRIQGTTFNPLGAGDPRFLTASTTDNDPPLVGVSLKNDTGDNDSDRLTNDITIVGRATDIGFIASLRAGLDNRPLDKFRSILSLLDPSGVFTITRARLETINGAPLIDGEHTLNLRAIDDRGNVTLATLTFTLDTTPPAQPTLLLDGSSDTPPLGDRQTTLASVKIVGVTSPNVLVQLVQLGTTATSDDNGRYEFEDVPLALGGNSLTVRATDSAGNTSTRTEIFTRQ